MLFEKFEEISCRFSLSLNTNNITSENEFLDKLSYWRYNWPTKSLSALKELRITDFLHLLSSRLRETVANPFFVGISSRKRACVLSGMKSRELEQHHQHLSEINVILHTSFWSRSASLQPDAACSNIGKSNISIYPNAPLLQMFPLLG